MGRSRVRYLEKNSYLCGSMTKTNAIRLLEKAKIPFDVREYAFDPDDLAAQHVADALGEDINQVFKTLVLHGERAGYFVCVVPGNTEVDLKKAAKVAGAKKTELIPMKELLPLTGYIRGGCSPVGLKKPFPIYIHYTALDYDQIFVSAGTRGLQLCIAPSDLIAFTHATPSDLTVSINDMTESDL